MAELDAGSDMDAQDVAETFDETLTDGDGTDSDALDLRRDTYDAMTRLGDADLAGVDDALDADEEDDDVLDHLDDDGEDSDAADEDGDDLVDDDGLAREPLEGDNLPMTSDDVDFEDEDDVDGVSRAPSEDAEEISMSDVDSLGGERGERVSDYESDTLSDSDLKDLDYKDAATSAGKDERPPGPAIGAETPQHSADDDVDVPSSTQPAERESQRLDEGLEETFPASDPVSAKHIT